MPSATESGVLLDLKHTGTLLVAFGGLWGRLGPLPVSEFRRTISSVGASCAYVRDHHGAWYHRGVEGVGQDIDAVADWIGRMSVGYERTVMVGNSAGGYAALLFGALLNREAWAFSPQTFIDPVLRERHGDFRWQESVTSLVESRWFDRRYADLAPVLSNSTGTFHVHYGSADRLDALHAEWVAEYVSLYPVEGSGHDTIRVLRDSGAVKSMVRTAR